MHTHLTASTTARPRLPLVLLVALLLSSWCVEILSLSGPHQQFEDGVHQEWIRRYRSPSNATNGGTETPSSLRTDVRQNLSLAFARAIHSVAAGITRSSARRRGGRQEHGNTFATSSSPSKGNCLSGPKGSGTGSRNFLPASSQYGADPSGRRDSTAAFHRLVRDVLSCQEGGFDCHRMASGIVDLGGATIDLEGGQYLISDPIYIPPLYGNLNILNGELRAGPSFPTHRWMIEIGNLTECSALDPERGVCHELINLQDLLLHTGEGESWNGGGNTSPLTVGAAAAGGVKVDRIMGMTMDAVFVAGSFHDAGIQVNEGHEVEISNSWVGDHPAWSDDYAGEVPVGHRRDGTESVPSKTVGIQINGHDHYITNTFLFGGPAVTSSSSTPMNEQQQQQQQQQREYVGVEINGTAAVLQGVATLMSPPATNNSHVTGIQLGNGISGTFGNRMMGCYLERGNSLDLYSPVRTIVEGTFLNMEPNALRIIAGTTGKSTIDGLILRSNIYSLGDDENQEDRDNNKTPATSTIKPISVVGEFYRVRNVQIDDHFDGVQLSTKVTKSLTKENATSWKIDFREELLFSLPIDRIFHSVIVSGSPSDDWVPPFSSMARPAVGTLVEVVTSVPVHATVFITVEQAV
jgi:hypothetical protein